jgi:hypothetical protein
MAFRRTRRRECPVKQESLQANLDGLLNLRNVSGVSHLIEQLVQIMQRGLLIQRGIRRSIGSPDMKGGKKRSAWLRHLKPKHRNSIFGFGFSTLSVLTVSVCLPSGFTLCRVVNAPLARRRRLADLLVHRAFHGIAEVTSDAIGAGFDAQMCIYDFRSRLRVCVATETEP